ncbi:MAG: serine--tRNA ligase [Desulfurococcales archaeon]|nr:serine--tRNA ligase [Desulfurococcales archaeon]
MSWSILALLRENPELLKEQVKRRLMDSKLVDEAKKIDEAWRKALTGLNNMRSQHNKLSRSLKEVQDSSERQLLIQQARELANSIKREEEKLQVIEEKRRELLLALPNIVEDDVPIGEEDASIPIRFWGKPKVWIGYINIFLEQTKKYGFAVDYDALEEKPTGHADMLEQVLKLGDTLKAGEVAGSRFFYLFQDIIWLETALLAYAIDKMTSKGYTLVMPPYMLRGKIIKRVIDLETFKDAIYKIENEDLYLIATAEHPLAALYSEEELYDGELPLKLVGISPCFRKEAGAGNRDLKGIFRVHQFHKVEQFVYSLPEESKGIHEEIIKNAEDIFQGLGLPYRIINIASGDLGACAVKKYDLEVWMPAQGKFREMVSASNCTDWQAYRLKIRLIRRKGMERSYVHTLNSTAIASTRTITAILENYQNKDGTITIPQVLRKYLEAYKAAPKDYIHPAKKITSPKVKKKTTG